MNAHRNSLGRRIRSSQCVTDLRRAFPYVICLTMAALFFPAVRSFCVVAVWIGTFPAILAFWVPVSVLLGLAVAAYIGVGKGRAPKS